MTKIEWPMWTCAGLPLLGGLQLQLQLQAWSAGCHTALMVAAVGPSFFLYSPHQLAAGQYPPQSSRTSHLLYSTYCYANANAMQRKTEAITPAK
ncbi:hypothetical protein SLA2020_053190 [Shorea laevis]